jgi:hypothetical protein
MKASREKKPERFKALQKAYKAVNAERIRATQKAYRQQKLGCVECRSWPDWREGLPHYDGHCFCCFSEKFPTHEKVAKARVDRVVRDFIDRNFPDFVHDKPMHMKHCDCTVRRRVDHRREVRNTLLCVETDEMHHRSYDKDDDQARYHCLMMGWGGGSWSSSGSTPTRTLSARHSRKDWSACRSRSPSTSVGSSARKTRSPRKHHLYYPEGTPDLY